MGQGQAGQELFRQRALRRLAEGESLDERVRLTGPKVWAALAAVALAVAAAIGWGFLGTIQTTVGGPAILIHPGGVFPVTTLSSGRLRRFLVEVGDVVKEGQVVARVEQPERERELVSARAELAAAKESYEKVAGFETDESRLRLEELATQELNLRERITHDEAQLKWLDAKVAQQEKLFADGIVPADAVARAQGEAYDRRDAIARGRRDLAAVGTQRLQTDRSRHQNVFNAFLRLEEARRKVAHLERTVSEGTEVTTPFTGRVNELTAGEGFVVSAGSPVLWLELLEGALEAVAFLPAGPGKRVARGMRVELAPDTSDGERGGIVLGTVRSVSDFPSTDEGMMRILGNPGLVKSLSSKGPTLLCAIDLLPDPARPGRYRWASSRGPDLELTSGTTCAAQVVLRTERPAALVVPALGRVVGR